jgi:hypothetical protein
MFLNSSEPSTFLQSDEIEKRSAWTILDSK